MLVGRFDFSSEFFALGFFVLRDLSYSQFLAADFNWRQFNAKSQMKSSPKLVPFFALNRNCGL